MIVNIPVRRALRGYHPDSVRKAVEAMQERYEQQKRTLEAEIARLEREIAQLQKEGQIATGDMPNKDREVGKHE